MNSTVLFRAIIGHQLRKIRDNTRKLLSRYNPEAVHDLRVAALRTDFALKFFSISKKINKIKKTRNKLKAARQVMGEARNFDILLSHAKKKKHIISPIQSRKNKSHHALVRTLGSSLYDRVLKDLKNIKNHHRVQGLSAIIKGPFKQTIAQLLDYRREHVNGDNLHKIRMAFKKLRYACEFLEDTDKPRMQKVLKFIVRFQDLLGARQDSIASVEILSRLDKNGTDKIIRMEKDNIKNLQKKFEKLWEKSFLKPSVIVRLHHWVKQQ